MKIEQNRIIDLVNNQLAIDLNCNKDDFYKDGIIYTNVNINNKQRKCIREEPYAELITIGQSCVITVDKRIKNKIEKKLKGKTRNEISEMNIFIESEIHYIPDTSRITNKKEFPKEFIYEIKRGKEIEELYGMSEFKGFDNSIQYGKNYVGPDEIVLYAKYKDKIIGMAGASKDTEEMWQIGVDVKKEHRSRGLATALVSNLANIILEKGKIPYYSTTSSNIPSQLVAYKTGFMPFWYSMKIINHDIIK